jgi:hypothetical protein
VSLLIKFYFFSSINYSFCVRALSLSLWVNQLYCAMNGVTKTSGYTCILWCFPLHNPSLAREGMAMVRVTGCQWRTSSDKLPWRCGTPPVSFLHPFGQNRGINIPFKSLTFLFALHIYLQLRRDRIENLFIAKVGGKKFCWESLVGKEKKKNK